MPVTQATHHAFHALTYMVRHLTLLPISSKTIARAENIPPSYLAKIFQKLGHAGILQATPGRDRGYDFARPPEQISLLDVFVTIEGEQLFDSCFMGHGECRGNKAECPIFQCWQAAVAKVRDFLAQTSVAEIAWKHPDYCSKTFATLDPSAALPPDDVTPAATPKRPGRKRRVHPKS